MAFITPNFGLNTDADSEIISPEVNEEGGVESYLFVEKLDGHSKPKDYSEPIIRDRVIMWEDHKGTKLVLTADGNLIKE